MKKVMAAVKALIESNGKILVLKQDLGSHEVWDLPGGKVEYGEDPYDALRREVKEEVGMDIEIIKPLGMIHWFRVDEHQVVATTFLCKSVQSGLKILANPDEEKITAVEWVKPGKFLSDKYTVSHQSLKKLIAEQYGRKEKALLVQ